MAEANPNRVSAAYVDSVICNKQTMHEGLLRNQFFCPKLKDNIMTAEFMKGVVGFRKYWLPNASDIRLRNCVQPPCRFELAKLVSSKMILTGPTNEEPFDSSFRRTAEMIVEKPPSAPWLLALLSTMDPNHVIFNKDYVKPKPVRVSDQEDVCFVDNPNDFFTGLPVLSRGSKKGHIKFTAPVNSSQQKLIRYQQQMEQLQARMHTE